MCPSWNSKTDQNFMLVYVIKFMTCCKSPKDQNMLKVKVTDLLHCRDYMICDIHP